MSEASKPVVMVVSGSIGSGKTTLIRKLAEKLGGAPALIFDEYEGFAEWPADINAWIQMGADPNQVKVPRMKADLLALLAGEAVTHPIQDRKIEPGDWILVEDPFGTERGEMAALVDLLLFVDVPADMCVVRMVQRALGMDAADFDQVIEHEEEEALRGRLRSVALWLRQYLWMRSGLGITEEIKGKADIILDGMQAVDELAEEALYKIRMEIAVQR